MRAPRLRFAPSPTGYLHVGGARTALFNWALARRLGGTFILRIEDTDRQRSEQVYVEAILDAMRWLGLDWDEGPDVGGAAGPYFQMERLDLYRRAAEDLLARNLAYRCICPAREDAETSSPVTCSCAARTVSASEGGALRFRTPAEGQVTFLDLIHGDMSFPCADLEDFVLLKADGVPTYNFAAVVDDAGMQITHVVRGDDHLSNTPKQVLIYQALGYETPAFAHIPMILGPDRKRLSKRHGAVSIQQFREDGYLPEALTNYLARLGWAHGDMELFDLEELVAVFSLEGVGKAPAVFDYDKLAWAQAAWLKRLPPQELRDRLLPWFEAAGLPVAVDEPARLEALIQTLVPRSVTLDDLVRQARFYFDVPLDWDEEASGKVLVSAVVPILRALAERLATLADWSPAPIEDAFRTLASELGIKAGAVIQPARVALTGRTASPGMFEVAALLGRDLTLKRLEASLSKVTEGVLQG
ncbi:MAG: glutamate--tRNA ligase [Candidatus Sericytochromatia bacterium]|nr:glutamate--tRNA ligase [Candidatus Sericytochromatia bacterium]